MYEVSDELADYVQSLPKTETHLHLEGSCPLELIERYAPGLFGKVPYMWDDDFRYENFTHFTEIFALVATTVFKTPQIFYECAKVAFTNCAAQNVRYVEMSGLPFCCHPRADRLLNRGVVQYWIAHGDALRCAEGRNRQLRAVPSEP